MLQTLMKLTIALMAALGICLAFSQTNSPKQTNREPIYLYLTNYGSLLYTNAFSSDYKGTNFLTISNRPYLRFDYVYVLRVTDAEWKLLTNHFADKIETNNIEFYGH